MSRSKPEEFIDDILKCNKNIPTLIVYQKEICAEEVFVEKQVNELGCETHAIWNSSLLHENDLQ